MNRAYYSSVLNYPIDHVWNLVRDFNNYPKYIDGVTESVIENGKAGDEVGVIRRFHIGESWVRQRLMAHSDVEYSFSYTGLDPRNFTSKDGFKNTVSIGYTGTLKLIQIIDGNRTFIEWFIEFDGPRENINQLNTLFTKLISQWVDSLARALCKPIV